MAWLAIFALQACALLWGTQHAVIKSLVLSSALPVVINALRFTIAAAVTSLASCGLELARRSPCRSRCCHPSGPGSDATRDGVAAASGCTSGGGGPPPRLLPVAAELALWQSLGSSARVRLRASVRVRLLPGSRLGSGLGSALGLGVGVGLGSACSLAVAW